MRRILIVVVVLAIALASCGGSRPRTILYRDMDTGLTVSVTCDYSSFTEVRDDGSCNVYVVDDGL